MTQLGIPVDVPHSMLALKNTLGGAITLCAELAGKEGKEVMGAIHVDGKPLDKAQWSRWESGQEGVMWPKFTALMDFCGNDAPLLWMLRARGYDLSSLRKLESETERELRLAREEIAQLKAAREIERNLFRDLRVNA